MLVKFLPIFVADTELIYGYNFVVPLTVDYYFSTNVSFWDVKSKKSV